jgi:predicted ATP-grasp superfamily ATP-dependent carboligase
MTNVQVIYFKRATEIKLKQPYLVVCMPTPGLSGIMAGLYLCEKAGFEIIGYLSSDSYAPVISVHNSIAMPPVRIMASEKANMIMVISEIGLPISAVNKTADAIMEISNDYKVKEIGILLTTGEADESIYYLTQDKKLEEKFKSMKIKKFDEGALSGVGSILYIKAQQSLTPCYTLIAVHQDLIDIKATKNLVKTLSKLYNLNIPLDDLTKQEQEFLKAEEEILREEKGSKEMYE